MPNFEENHARKLKQLWLQQQLNFFKAETRKIQWYYMGELNDAQAQIVDLHNRIQHDFENLYELLALIEEVLER